mmetsp:Transcript_5239/g.13371  ORF Transcript_5239/g.13371 Transcript_5239/m.13371 type:complete len:204 (-) Transcript_5239:477-1088(-)
MRLSRSRRAAPPSQRGWSHCRRTPPPPVLHAASRSRRPSLSPAVRTIRLRGWRRASPRRGASRRVCGQPTCRSARPAAPNAPPPVERRARVSCKASPSRRCSASSPLQRRGAAGVWTCRSPSVYSTNCCSTAPAGLASPSRSGAISSRGCARRTRRRRPTQRWTSCSRRSAASDRSTRCSARPSSRTAGGGGRRASARAGREG